MEYAAAPISKHTFLNFLYEFAVALIPAAILNRYE